MAGWSQWPGSAPFSVTPCGPPMYRPTTHEGSPEGPSGSSSFYQSPPPYRFQTPSPYMIQTPPHSLFYQVAHRPISDNQMPCRKKQNPHRRNHNHRRKLDKGGI
ncbi:hypothetical protein Goshw_028776 [Gossypium schwendimanii]|uniref:Uncharacterized protein n=1 Tax=Gossypium schwendimanii TaxID=34291 RepID=A0A7J9N087_GOSSC|nr:hypothetical protein [Gossypium schwendimanii]